MVDSTEGIPFFPNLGETIKLDFGILSMDPDVNDSNCNQIHVRNKTHFIYGGYEGIPENLLINLCGWIILLSLFTVLRKKAWNYGRLALVQKYESRSKHHGLSQYNVWTQLFYGNEADAGRRGSETDSISSTEFNIHIDKGFFSWILALFKIKEEHILSKCGKDASQYLSFQRHIIVYMMIVCFVSIVVILPINFQGNLEGSEKDFGHTTMANLDPTNPLMWVHVTLAFLFLPLGIMFTRRFSQSLHLQEKEMGISRTIMITHVPRRFCHKDTLLRHFQEIYSDIEVQDIQFAYDIKALMAYDKQREVARNAKVYSETYLKETNQRLDIRPYKCGVICCCCDVMGCPKVDAIEYYSGEEVRLSGLADHEKVRALQRPTGVAFVTMDSVANAQRVLNDHRVRLTRCLTDPPASSSVTRDLKPHNWVIRVAPDPKDVYWANLAVTTRHWYLKAFIINLILFIVLFFLTTPAVIINSLDIVPLEDIIHGMSPIVSEFLPTLLLWTMAALMPVLVSYSDQFMSHWTRSSENHSVMRKTFVFLLFMVIILPSLGLTSAKAFVEWLAHQNQKDQTYRWKCIFLPDKGAFFVNYIITAAFIGTALELIRFPELFMYILRLVLARSPAETGSIRLAILYEFPFGVQYAWMLLIFAMNIIYSVSCPLITPFGTLYMILKHLVDKYNIYFAYGPSKISKSIHRSAVNFVVVSIVFLQLSLLFLSIIRQGIDKDLTIYSIVLLVITCLVFIGHNMFHWCKRLSPIHYKPTSNTTTDESEPDFSGGIRQHTESSSASDFSVQFVPWVLQDPLETRCQFPSLRQHRVYGTQPQDEVSYTSESTMSGPEDYNRDQMQTGSYQEFSTQQQVARLDVEVDICIPDAPRAKESWDAKRSMNSASFVVAGDNDVAVVTLNSQEKSQSPTRV